MNSTLESLTWRYATKQFDPEKKISSDQMGLLTEALRLTPSSFGLQPWKFFIVENADIRSQLRKASWDQPQITDASHVIVLTRRTDIDTAFVDAYIEEMAKTRNSSIEDLKEYSEMIKGSIARRDESELGNWAAKQVYIALGNLLTVAAIEKIDACPMEGFDPAQYDAILGLTEKNLTTVVVAPVGYRSDNDKYAHSPKVRFSKEDIIEHIS